MGFGGSKPKRQPYEEQADTPWITSNRELMGDTYENIQYQLPRIDVMDDATRAGLESYIDDIYNRAESDFDRAYAQTMNKYLQRDYNRFGTTGASSSLLNRDNYNLQQQRKLADLAYNRASTYNDFLNNELARRYQNLSTNYAMFGDAGQTTQAFDDANWKIRNTNKDINYINDVQDYNSKMGTWNAIGKGLSTAASFIPVVGPALGIIGNVATEMLTQPVEATGNSPYGVFGSDYGQQSASRYNTIDKNMGAYANALWDMYGKNWQNATNRILKRENQDAGTSSTTGSNQSLWGGAIPLSSLAQQIYSGNTPRVTDPYGLYSGYNPYTTQYQIPVSYRLPTTLMFTT